MQPYWGTSSPDRRPLRNKATRPDHTVCNLICSKIRRRDMKSTLQEGSMNSAGNIAGRQEVSQGEPLELLHVRKIEMRGARRADGLFQVEGRVTDRKPYVFTAASGGRIVPADAPVHDLGVRLVFDSDMYVVDVQTFTDAAPYDVCPGGGQALQSMKGVRIGPGWSSEVRKRLSGARSCTHLMELLMPLATTAIQAMSSVRAGQPEPLDANGRPKKIDSCYAYAADGELVRRRWPQFFRRA
jgi:hypothetical protein